MTNEEFLTIVDEGEARSLRVLLEKGDQYNTIDGDRLGQFKAAARLAGTNPAEELVNMAKKHFTSIINMSRNPESFSKEAWLEVTTDLRNYTHLLEGVLKELAVI